MIRTVRCRAPVATAALAGLCSICAGGCGVPVAPGYQIKNETLAVHFVPGTPPHFAIRAEYRLANIGNAPLHFIGVELPGEKTFGRSNLRAEIDGKEIILQHNPHETPDDWRVPMAAPWRQKEKITLTLAYDLATVPSTDPRIFAAANMFYLNDSGWFPGLMGFKAFLSPAITRPNPTDLVVTVPPDFRVTAAGQPGGTKNQSGEIEHRFRIRKGDFDPYVLAGQYQQQIVTSAGVTVAIWTFNPIPADQAQETAAQVATAANFCAKNFGPLPRSMKAIYSVQPGKSVFNEGLTWKRWQGLLLPGVIYDPTLDPAESLGKGLDSFISSATGPLELPNTWFEHMIVARPDSWVLGGGLIDYSSDTLDESMGKSRAEAIASDLSGYDQNRVKAVEKPIASLTPDDPQAQLDLLGDKIDLFFFALEDKCGQQNVTHAIHDMVYALRGEDYGYSDFRAALEQQCHQDLDGFFRTWLAQPGIPPDFRARYQGAGGNKP